MSVAAAAFNIAAENNDIAGVHVHKNYSIAVAPTVVIILVTLVIIIGVETTYVRVRASFRPYC